MPAHTTPELGQDIQRAWELLEQDTGETSAELADLCGHFDWVLRKWSLAKGQRETIEPLSAAIRRELKTRGYDCRAAKCGELVIKKSVAKKMAGGQKPPRRLQKTSGGGRPA